MKELEFNLNLMEDLSEACKQLTASPRAMHPQMESIFVDRSGKSMMSFSACGFHMLGAIENAPAALADELGLGVFSFNNALLLSFNTKVFAEVGMVGQEMQLSRNSCGQLEKFITAYCSIVYRIEGAIVIMIKPNSVYDVTYDGERFLTFSIALMWPVEQEEWEKLFDMKKIEMDWAEKFLQARKEQSQEVLTGLVSRLTH